MRETGCKLGELLLIQSLGGRDAVEDCWDLDDTSVVLRDVVQTVHQEVHIGVSSTIGGPGIGVMA